MLKKENTILYFSTEEIIALENNITSEGGYRRSNGAVVRGEFKGIPMLNLFDFVGGINESYNLKVTSADGFVATYSYAEVLGNVNSYNNTGHDQATRNLVMTLIYEEIGEDELNGGPLRTAFLHPDYVSDGGKWAKDVVRLEFVEADPLEEGMLMIKKGNNIIYLSLDELLAMDGNITEFGGRMSKSGTITRAEYNGLPILLLLALIGSFNESYSLRVVATDGWTTTYTYQQIMGNVTSYDLDGENEAFRDLAFTLLYEEIGEDTLPDGPLRTGFLHADFVTASNLWAKQVYKLELVIL